jgi:hypothetical protein
MLNIGLSAMGDHMRSRGIRLLAITTGILAVVWVAGPSNSRYAYAAARPGGPLAPASGAYWGMTTNYAGGLAGRETQLGRAADVHNMFFSWTDHFPGGGQLDDVANGRVPMVSWEPFNTTLADIAGGGQDANIVSHARAMRDFGQPIFLRFAHEMNGNWYPWSGTNNGGSVSGPANYVAAWRHVHDVFLAEGASNVVWIWCVNQNDSPGVAWNHWGNYYPGDSYVDWVGIDAYNWGVANGGWRPFSSLINASAYNDYAASKPIMVAETASSETGGNKARWIGDLGSAVKNSFPSIEAVLWFDKTGTADNWSVDSSDAALSAYRNVGQDTYFGGPGIADVVVTGISWSPAAPTNGDLVLFSATIANRGTAPTPDGVVIGAGFFVDGVKTNWYGVLTDPLAPGQSRAITASGGPRGTRNWTAVSGTHTLRVLVDDVNRFPEFNENNNDLTVPITVR